MWFCCEGGIRTLEFGSVKAGSGSVAWPDNGD